MYDQYTYVLGTQISTYSAVLISGILLSFSWTIWQSESGRRTAIFDVAMGALVGGVLAGRVLHVISQWGYFKDHVYEIARIHVEGGLNWHGAVFGTLVGALFIARIHNIQIRRLWDHAGVIIALLAVTGWWACGAAGCAYGKTIESMADYPGWITWAEPDIFGILEPRFATQRLGFWCSSILLVVAVLLNWRGWIKPYRFPLVLAILAIMNFNIAFLRGDFSVFLLNLRLDQWMDLGMTMVAVLIAIFHWIRAWRSTPASNNL